MDLLFHLPARWDDRRSLARIGELEGQAQRGFVGRVLLCDFGGGACSGPAGAPNAAGAASRRWWATRPEPSPSSGSAAASRSRSWCARTTCLLVAGEVKRYRFTKQLLHPEVEALEQRRVGRGRPRRAAQHHARLRHARGHPPARAAARRPARRRASCRPAGGSPAGCASPGARAAGARAGAARPASAAARERPRGAARRRSPAYTRLVLEELYLLELGLALRREGRARDARSRSPDPGAGRARPRAPAVSSHARATSLGGAAGRPRAPAPMHRLLEGDVGSGKTVVALLAALAVAEAGCQIALMAPTELLAEQHAARCAAWRERARASSLRIALLTASVPRAAAGDPGAARGRRARSGGGHARAGPGGRGVPPPGAGGDRRAAPVRRAPARRAGAQGRRGSTPHTLVMTATPIPRTLALTLYGDLDLSILDELPPGRRRPGRCCSGKGRARG